MYCKNCGFSVPDNAFRCPNCGAVNETGYTADYTAQYDPRDVQDNKVYAALSYLSILFVIPLLCARHSYYARFHVNQGIVLLIFAAIYNLLQQVITKVLWSLFSFFPLIPGAVSAVLSLFGLVFVVLMILGIVNAATGKARELPIIGKIHLLK